jgi:hypothetical protein
MPRYDELSVRKFYPMLMMDETFARYLPDATPDNRLPDRNYFWNIANTVRNIYVQNVVKHAKELRMLAS